MGLGGWERAGGGGAEWEDEGGLRVPLVLIQQQCVFSKWYRQSQFTG